MLLHILLKKIIFAIARILHTNMYLLFIYLFFFFFRSNHTETDAQMNIKAKINVKFNFVFVFLHAFKISLEDLIFFFAIKKLRVN